MLAYTVHDVRLIPVDQTESTPRELIGMVSTECSCGHTDDPMPQALARLLAHMHIHGLA